MIIQKQKSFEDILEALGDEQKIFIFGCADCATACKTGGEEELADMKTRLEDAGKTVTGTVVADTACMRGEVRKKAAEFAEQIDAADGVLVLACGTGVQTIGDLTGKSTHTGVDALFIGETVRQGKYIEKCSACGQCILEDTGGICPVTRCSKGLLNGPCGGYSEDGKCEVDPEKDCAWILIYERLKETGRLDKMREVQGAKDYSTAGKARLYQWERSEKQKA